MYCKEIQISFSEAKTRFINTAIHLAPYNQNPTQIQRKNNKESFQRSGNDLNFELKYTRFTNP